MSDLPQFKESQPKFSPQSVSSREAGFNSLSQVFGGISKIASDTATTMLDEESSANAVQSQNMLADMTTNAHIQMINNPDMATEIEKNSAYTIDSVIKGAYVNDKDRQGLERLSNSYTNQIKVMSAQTSHKQMISNSQIDFYKEFPSALKDIDRLSFGGDLAGAQLRQDNLMKNLDSMLSIGAITGLQYEKYIGLIQNNILRTKLNMDMAGSDNATAVNVHEANNTPYGRISTDQANLPSNAHTASLANHATGEVSLAKSESDIYRYGYIASPQETQNLSSDQLTNLHEQWSGANSAQAHINSNGNQIAIRGRYDELDKLSKSSGLSLRETGEYRYLKSFYARLENDFVGTMKETTEGAKIHQASINNNIAIQNSSSLSADEKVYRLKQNEDAEATQLVNLWENGQGGDPAYSKPLSNAQMAAPRAAFDLGQNPDLLISAIRSTSKEIQPFIASSMGTSEQQATVSIISQAGDNISQDVPSALIRGNQTGREFKVIKEDKDSNKLSGISKTLATNNDIADMTYFQSLQPDDPKSRGSKGTSLQVGTINALTNAALYMAEKNNDIGVNQLPTYVTKLASAAKAAYNLYRDTNVVFNNSTLNETEHNMAAIGSFAKSEVYKSLRGTMSDIELMDLIDRQPIMITNTANNRIVAINSVTHEILVDKDKNPIFSWAYSPTLVNAARHSKNEYDIKMMQKQNEKMTIHPFGNTFQ